MKNTILPLQLLVHPSLQDVRPLILYHGRRCPDGYGAALAAWLARGGEEPAPAAPQAGEHS